MQTKTKKIYELENLRAIAFIGVVLQHVVGSYIVRENLSKVEYISLGMLFGIAKFAVPAFIFLTGFLLTEKYLDDFKYFEFLRKKLSKIVIPYFAFCFIYSYIYPEKVATNTKDWLVSVFTGTIHYHTWYLFMLTFMYLALPITFFVLRITRKICDTPKKAFVGCTVIMTLYCILVWLLPHFYGNPITYNLLYKNATKNPLYYVAYFLIGGIISLYYETFLEFLNKNFKLLVGVSLISFGYSEYLLFSKGFIDDKLSLNYMPMLSVPSVILSTTFILLFLGFSIKLLKFTKLTSILQWLAKYSFIAYLYHTTILQKIFDFTPNLTYPTRYLLIFIVTIITSCGLGFTYEYFKKKFVIIKQKAMIK